jgi:hypothetical protein
MFKFRWAGIAMMAVGMPALGAVGCSSSSSEGVPSEGGAGGDDSGGADSTTTADGPDLILPGLGDPCKANTDCKSDLTCIKSTDDLLGGGPAGGYCSLPCSINGDCVAFGGRCVRGDGVQALCLLSCTPGPAVDITPKCGDRRDVACEGLVSGTSMMASGGACFPFCADDSECGTRKCDIGSGQCVDTLPTGLPIGSGCTANVMPDPCNGVCAPLENGTGPVPGLCTALCRYGRLEGCGYRVGALDASSSVAAACAIPGSQDDDIGDIGLCLQLCDADGDCLAPDFACELAAVPRWQHGVCLPKAPADVDAGPQVDAAPPPEDATPPSDAGAPPPDAPSSGD